MVEEKELEIQLEVRSYTNDISVLVIDSPETFEEAGDALVKLKKLSKKITTWFLPMKEAANKAHKEITTREKAELSPIKQAEELIRTKRVDYKTEQDKIAEEEQRLLEEKERERVAEEQEKTLKEAVEAETPEQQEELLTKAEETVAQPVFAPKPIQKTSVVNGGGTVTWIKDTSVEVQDVRLVCAGIASGDIPVSVVQFSSGKLKTWVKSMGIKPGSVPGLLIRETQRESVRA